MFSEFNAHDNLQIFHFMYKENSHIENVFGPCSRWNIDDQQKNSIETN